MKKLTDWLSKLSKTLDMISIFFMRSELNLDSIPGTEKFLRSYIDNKGLLTSVANSCTRNIRIWR